MRFIVTDQGPLDWHQPGEDVTDLYPPDVRDRLIEDGYLMAEDNEPAEEDEDENGA